MKPRKTWSKGGVVTVRHVVPETPEAKRKRLAREHGSPLVKYLRAKKVPEDQAMRWLRQTHLGPGKALRVCPPFAVDVPWREARRCVELLEEYFRARQRGEVE